jgi:glycerophosphoryl diester phosphodiesterase
MTHVITHRGIDPSITDFPYESSREAFRAHLVRGYGIEFDPNRAADGWIVLHDKTLTRITGGNDTRKIVDVPLQDLLTLNLQDSHLATLQEVLALIEVCSVPSALSAIHLKHGFQSDTKNLDVLVDEMALHDCRNIILFDVTLKTAEYLKGRNASLQLAPSVAHPYDIERYGASVGNTLLSVEEALAHRKLFDWVWLDEWDLSDNNGAEKKLYTKDIFDCFRAAGMKIALVSPELHNSSPGLLGGEAHPDAKDMDTLNKRLEEIISLSPDAICTDYPDLAKNIIEKSSIC